MKKAGSLTMCIDYLQLNKVNIKNTYPLQLIDDLFDQLPREKYISKIDLRSGYHQLRIKSENIPKMVFRTRYGNYKFLVMSFGLTNAPTTFMNLINRVFQSYIDSFVIIFNCDILVYSKNDGEHMDLLRVVIQVLKQNKLFAKYSKNEFWLRSLEFLGHINSSEKLKVDLRKIEVVMI